MWRIVVFWVYAYFYVITNLYGPGGKGYEETLGIKGILSVTQFVSDNPRETVLDVLSSQPPFFKSVIPICTCKYMVNN